MINPHYQYLGMTYEQASREGERLVKQAAETGNWFAILDRLIALREVMNADSLRTTLAAGYSAIASLPVGQ